MENFGQSNYSLSELRDTTTRRQQRETPYGQSCWASVTKQGSHPARFCQGGTGCESPQPGGEVKMICALSPQNSCGSKKDEAKESYDRIWIF